MNAKQEALKNLRRETGVEELDAYEPDISYDPGGFFENYGAELAGKPYGELPIRGREDSFIERLRMMAGNGVDSLRDKTGQLISDASEAVAAPLPYQQFETPEEAMAYRQRQNRPSGAEAYLAEQKRKEALSPVSEALKGL